MTTRLSNPRDLVTLAGTRLGTSACHDITQERVNLFADATADHQWIHVDPGRAKSGPFGGTIAHGYLTVSLATTLLADVLHIDDVNAVINYGINKVRCPSARKCARDSRWCQPTSELRERSRRSSS
jgi:acyl dehydratase